MAIPANQIGRGTEENLLWQISKQLEALTGVTYNSKKYILNVTDPHYNNPNVKAKIETFSGAWAGTAVDGSTPAILTIDLNESSAFILEFSIFSFSGNASVGTLTYTALPDGRGNMALYDNRVGDGYIGFNVDRVDNLASVYIQTNFDADIEMVYTIKKFTTPMYND